MRSASSLVTKAFLALLSLALFTHAEETADTGSASPFSAYFPAGMMDADGGTIDVSSLNGKLVGIYFSAHWCGPCRQFTPSLIQYRNRNAENFEVVFVSSDTTAEDQLDYMKSAQMPWPALKWQSEAAGALEEKFQVSGIPTLVLIKPDGSVLTRNGRAHVMDNTPAEKLKTAEVKIETYKCGFCTKDHERESLVFQE